MSESIGEAWSFSEARGPFTIEIDGVTGPDYFSV
jgi:hypothetical protein